MTNLIIALIGALGVGILVSGALYPLRRRLDRANQDVAGLEGVDQLSEREELETIPPLLDRAFGPIIQELVGFMDKDDRRAEILDKLRRSGWRYPSVGDFYAQKVMTAGLFFLGGAGAIVVIGNPGLFFLPFLFGALGLFIPNREVNQALKKRREALYHDMAFSLDRLALLVRSGLAFQQALVELTKSPGGGILLTSLRGAVTQVMLGTPLHEALDDMRDSLPREPELDKFVERSRQGGSIADALTAQAELMRRRVEADLLAKGLRSTMVITTVGGAFMLPAMALLVVGPPMMMAFKIFGQM